MVFLKQPLILPFIHHKSKPNSQNDSSRVSNSKLKPDLCIWYARYANHDTNRCTLGASTTHEAKILQLFRAYIRS